MGSNIKAVTDSSFDAEVIKSSEPILVDFWAEWCPPCKALSPKLDEIAEETKGKISIVKMDVDNNQNTATQFGIRSIPALLLFKNGKVVDQILGNQPKEKIMDFLKNHM